MHIVVVLLVTLVMRHSRTLYSLNLLNEQTSSSYTFQNSEERFFYLVVINMLQHRNVIININSNAKTSKQK